MRLGNGALQAAMLVACSALLLAARPAAAQIDFDVSGSWDQPAPGVTTNFGFVEDSDERAGGPTLVDYLGLPLTEEGRSRALAYDSALLGVPEHVCMRHPSTYSFWGPANLRIESELDANLDVVAYHVGGTFRRADRTIWMDGRPHPSKYAPHTWAGFTTGRWEGPTLVTRTTHIKWGWIRRNGVATTDQAEVITFYTKNDNVLTVTWMVIDPVYLSEPFVRSADFVATPRGVGTATFGVGPQDRGNNIFAQCLAREEIAKTDYHDVPHYLEGTNPFVGERATQLGVPVEATLGGAETALPEYKERLRR
ncbi:MAG: hypothetical protein AB7K63_11980 [Vicinamibacterales bacterium]